MLCLVDLTLEMNGSVKEEENVNFSACIGGRMSAAGVAAAASSGARVSDPYPLCGSSDQERSQPGQMT